MLFFILGLLISLLPARFCHHEGLVQWSISLWGFPLCSETELTAPSSLFPEHSVHPSSIAITMLYDSCLHSLSLHSSLNHLLMFYLKYPTQNEDLLAYIELQTLLLYFVMIVIDCVWWKEDHKWKGLSLILAMWSLPE